MSYSRTANLSEEAQLWQVGQKIEKLRYAPDEYEVKKVSRTFSDTSHSSRRDAQAVDRARAANTGS